MRPSLLLSAALLSICLLTLSACSLNKEEIKKLHGRNDQLQEKLYTAQGELIETQNTLKAEISAHQRTINELEPLKLKVKTLEAETEKARREFEDYKHRFHLRSRLSAVGEKLKELITRDGKTFRDITVESVLSEKITFSHASGRSSIRIDRFPPSWSRRFDYREDVPCTVDDELLADACGKLLRTRQSP